MKVLFIYYNRFKTLAAPPIGLSMVANSITDEHEVEFIDLMWEKQPVNVTLNKINEINPSVIAISIRNLDNQDSQNSKIFFAEIKPFIEEIRKVTEAKIVLGGTAYSTFPEELLDYLSADFGIHGQGEKVFKELIKGIDNRNINYNLPGLVCKKNGEFVHNPPIQDGYANSLFTPDNIFYNPKKYKKSFWPSVVITKSGCPYECVFCDVNATFGGKMHLRNIEDIIDELKYHKEKLKTSTIFFVDPCFNQPLDYAKSILKAIIKTKLRFFLGVTLRPDIYDEELFSLMKKAGVFFVGLGADTLSQTMLQNYNKGFDIKNVEECCGLLRKYKINYMMELILGGPGETKETIRETMDFLAKKASPTLTLLHTGIRLLPEAPIYKDAVKKGLVKNKSELLFPKYYVSEIDPKWIRKKIISYYKRFGYRQARLPLLFFIRKNLYLKLGIR